MSKSAKSALKSVVVVAVFCLLAGPIQASGDWRLQVGPSFVDGGHKMHLSLARSVFSSGDFALDIGSGYQWSSRFQSAQLVIDPRVTLGKPHHSLRPFFTGGAGIQFDFEGSRPIRIGSSTGSPFTSTVVNSSVAGGPLFTSSPQSTNDLGLTFSLGGGLEFPLSRNFQGLLQFGITTLNMGNLFSREPAQDGVRYGAIILQYPYSTPRPHYGWETMYTVSLGVSFQQLSALQGNSRAENSRASHRNTLGQSSQSIIDGNWRLQIGPAFTGRGRTLNLNLARTVYSTGLFSLDLSTGYQKIGNFNIVPMSLSPRLDIGSSLAGTKPYISGSAGVGHLFDGLTDVTLSQTNENFLDDFEVSNGSLFDPRRVPPTLGTRLRFSLNAGLERSLSNRIAGLFEFGVITQDISNLVRFTSSRSLPGLNLPDNTSPQFNSLTIGSFWHTSYYVSLGIVL